MSVSLSQVKSDFLRVMIERGFVHQISDLEGLDALFSKQVVTIQPPAAFMPAVSFRS